MNRSVSILVSGKVQGVCFRAATKKQADKLGVVGYAKNLNDGRVEINACGDDSAVSALINWSYKGSLFSKVKELEIIELEERESFSGFEIK
ncbi:MAG: acylphosphatase [Methylococcaceae bacterium]|nr:acylphosphatase [Methylococcaceae bacterium]